MRVYIEYNGLLRGAEKVNMGASLNSIFEIVVKEDEHKCDHCRKIAVEKAEEVFAVWLATIHEDKGVSITGNTPEFFLFWHWWQEFNRRLEEMK